ncbi:hypothetical protein ACFFS2_06040 [Streptomyces aurantiacus]|uniref:Uncharacterized protein n=1 Tax=Streptomyces aurantiacus TaxID=47760 RepID=A0A7G1P2T1_9ACTN|nr:hypothetical protein [Streptomyces aurantiacus]BCL28981.1 hypothetical protein GCM10017557_38400 [Streptomyces aurantiacus]
MVPRRTLRIDLAPRELPFWLLAAGGVVLTEQVGVDPIVALPAAFLAAIQVRLRLV